MGESKKFKLLEQQASEVAEWESEISPLSDDELTAKTDEFRSRHEAGESLEELLPEAFAVVRESSKRVLEMRHFDVQIIGGIVLFEGKIAEMKTGEGKTLAATLAVYLESIAQRGIHVVTVNDYLAKRDSEWMGQIYKFLKLDVGLLQNQMESTARRAAYQADVTYGTNSEFGFDYLRDNMDENSEYLRQRGHHYAIVDEVDSILVDEARTPLIISGAPEKAADIYKSFARIVPRLKSGEDFEVDEKTRTVAVTEEGVTKVEKALKIDNLYDHVNSQLVNHLNQGLKAHALFRKDVDYVIQNGEVIIVDEFTGRLMEGRRYSEGLHQAIEAKEKVRIREESQTLATITLQNYFRMYEKLAGMTGTAATEADEFRHIYKLETIIVPTHMPMVRVDDADLIYKTEAAKFRSVVKDIAERHKKGQPVLVGTISIERSELIGQMLKKQGVKHEILNAKQHEREAEIIANAGQRGAVTIATNMAGRGTDIVLGDGVVDVGGLHVLGTERHESRRIDNQLRGRSGRQGDAGSSQFYLSLEDDLLKLFGMDKIKSMMDRLSLPDDYPIEHSLVSRTIENAQGQVEAQNFEIRKQVLKYDDVMNRQREVIYAQRQEILFGEDISERVEEIISDAFTNAIDLFTNDQTYPEEWDWDGLMAQMRQLIPVEIDEKEFDRKTIDQEYLKEILLAQASDFHEGRRKEFGPEIFGQVQKDVLLAIVDQKWRDHLYEMDYLKEGIGLRAVGQRDPLIEYQTEGFAMFQEMVNSIKEDFVRYIFHVPIMVETEGQAQISIIENEPAPARKKTKGRTSGSQAAGDTKVGRNDPCPCGSGKKYKKCCGK